MYGGVCWWLIYTYIIMLANMENCWGLRFMFNGKKKKKTKKERIEVINIIILMMSVS